MAWWGGKKSNDNVDDDDDEDDEDGVLERDSDFNSTNDRIMFLIDGRLPMGTHSVSNSRNNTNNNNNNNNNNSSSSSSGGSSNNNGGGGEGESHLRHCLRFALSVMKLCVVKDSTSVGIMLLGAVSRINAGISIG